MCIYIYIYIFTYIKLLHMYFILIQHIISIQVYTYVTSYFLKKLPSYSLEHKPAIYNSMILVPTSSLILGFGV